MKEQGLSHQENEGFWQSIRPDRLVERYNAIAHITKMKVGATVGILGATTGIAIGSLISKGSVEERDILFWGAAGCAAAWFTVYMVNPFGWKFIRQMGGDVLYQKESNNYR